MVRAVSQSRVPATAMALVCLVALGIPAAGRAEFLPAGNRLFQSPVADPTSPAATVRLLEPVDGRVRAEINIGDEFGLISWGGGRSQLGIAAGVAARFDLSSDWRDLEVADYTLMIPLDVDFGRLSLRAAYQHTSSHLGDDYIDATDAATIKSVADEIRATVSLPFAPVAGVSARLYAGAGLAFNVLPDDSGRARLQGGAEIRQGSLFAAADLQVLERADWEPALAIRAGWTARGSVAALSIFVEYFSGPLPYLAFIDRLESRWALGLTLGR